ncbi:MAG: ABC transporter substrate-binding protein [Bacteroidales bacterium]
MRHLIFLQLSSCIFLCIVIFSCKGGHNEDVNIKGNFYTPRYASGFCIDTFNGKKILHITQPFQEAKKQHYSYCLENDPQRIICLSTTHLAMLKCIDQEHNIVGLANAKLVYDSIFYKKSLLGEIVDIGSNGVINIEKIWELRPDLILVYDIDGEFKSVIRKLKELNIPVLYIGEYVEKHPLGKTEWIIALAALWNNEEQGIKKFNEIESLYVEAKNKLEYTSKKTQVLLNAPWGNAWFLPGAQSYMNTFLLEANGESIVPLINQGKSHPFDIEYIFGFGKIADVWINPGSAQSLKELVRMHPLIPMIKNQRNIRIFNNNKRINSNGGNDFFESGVVCPHLILRDLIAIFHPIHSQHHSFVYYQQLK